MKIAGCNKVGWEIVPSAAVGLEDPPFDYCGRVAVGAMIFLSTC